MRVHYCARRLGYLSGKPKNNALAYLHIAPCVREGELEHRGRGVGLMDVHRVGSHIQPTFVRSAGIETAMVHYDGGSGGFFRLTASGW